ncbi:MAG TPA: hypothetical protein VLA19_15585 [Herpetosiphonaceae bacterium]|nr:hypothetical protein [Herpetosiphonaceae bacterium]
MSHITTVNHPQPADSPARIEALRPMGWLQHPLRRVDHRRNTARHPTAQEAALRQMACRLA